MHGRFVRVVRYGTGGEFCNDGAHMGSPVGPGGSDTRPDMEGFVFLFSLVGGSQPGSPARPRLSGPRKDA